MSYHTQIVRQGQFQNVDYEEIDRKQYIMN